MRRLRRAKIVATLGPASSDAVMIAKLFKAGADVFRINMSHTSQDRMRELVAMIRGVEKRYRAADRHPGRFAGTQAAARHLRRRLGDGGKRRELRARQRSGARRRHARLSAASGNLRRGRARAHAADRRRQGAAHGHASRAQAHDDARRGGRQIVRPQGRQPAGFDDSVLRPGREGPLRSRSRAQRRHRLGGAVVHPAAGGHRGGQEDHARPRRADGQDREAAGGDAAGRRSWISPTR